MAAPLPRALGLALVFGAAMACGGASGPPPPPESFVPFAVHFQGFRGWASRSLEGTATSTTFGHTAGPRTLFVNEPAALEAGKAAPGTIVVKVIGGGQTFAMAKRGGEYNTMGALGWEWFELAEDPGSVRIVWRGVGPPIGEGYAGDPQGGCNGCHAQSPSTDSILTPGLLTDR